MGRWELVLFRGLKDGCLRRNRDETYLLDVSSFFWWVARRSRIVYAHPTCVWTCMAALPSAHNSFNRTRGWRKQTERKKEYDENKNKERRCSESVVCIATTGKCERVVRLL